MKFPIPEKAGYEKFRNPASRYAMVGVFVAKTKAGVRVAVTGAGSDGVFRHKRMEAALATNFSADAIKGVKIDASTDALRPARRRRLSRPSRQRDGAPRAGRGGLTPASDTG